jgi:citrate synthase
MAEKWDTKITRVEPDRLLIYGYPLKDLVERKTLLDVAHLLAAGDLPDVRTREQLRKIALQGAMLPSPPVERNPKEDISKSLAKCILMDEELVAYPDRPTKKTAFALGRMARYLAKLNNAESAIADLTGDEAFSIVLYKVFTGRPETDAAKARLLEAMITACVDHGVTPPSAQATIIASSTRASFEVCIAQGVGAITDVHGGAGTKAAAFFWECTENSRDVSLKSIIEDYARQKKRIPGLGHRVHNNDPRRDVLWNLAIASKVAGANVEMSRNISRVFTEVTGKSLPINVDGVIGAIVADLRLDLSAAKSVFILGRVAGLSAHHYEELTRPQMRQISFEDAVYKGPGERAVPGGVLL